MVDGRSYKAHLLIWLIKTGEWPERQMDHRDTNKSNNRWSNFRLATNQQNHANRGRNKNNTTGFKDVIFIKDGRSRPWLARIMVNGRHIYLGYYGSPEEAARAVRRGHAHHFGEFSRA
jgi:HNH endonuclease